MVRGVAAAGMAPVVMDRAGPTGAGRAVLARTIGDRTTTAAAAAAADRAARKAGRPGFPRRLVSVLPGDG